MPNPSQIVTVGYTWSPGGPGTTETVTSVSPEQPRLSVSTTVYVTVSVGEACTVVALGLSSPAVGNHAALVAPSAINVTLSPKQIAVLDGVTSAATACTTTSIDAVPSPHVLTSVTLKVVTPGGGVRPGTGVRELRVGGGVEGS